MIAKETLWGLTDIITVHHNGKTLGQLVEEFERRFQDIETAPNPHELEAQITRLRSEGHGFRNDINKLKDFVKVSPYNNGVDTTALELVQRLSSSYPELTGEVIRVSKEINDIKMNRLTRLEDIVTRNSIILEGNGTIPKENSLDKRVDQNSEKLSDFNKELTGFGAMISESNSDLMYLQEQHNRSARSNTLLKVALLVLGVWLVTYTLHLKSLIKSATPTTVIRKGPF